jgi:acetylornithine deacetylase
MRVRSLLDREAGKKVAYATEAGQFQAAGVSSIVCGPGNIEQAHKANEFVSLEQLAECEEFLRKLVLEDR